MGDKRTSDLEAWEEHIEDYVVAETLITYATGEEKNAYHIFNIKFSLSHIIEDEIRKDMLVQEMLQAGVKLVSMEEAKCLLSPHKP